MNEENLLTAYQDISALTQRMLAAARQGEWDTLIELERECSVHFSCLASHDDGRARSPDFQRRKAQIIHGVLDDDAQIRLLVEPWLAQLSDLIAHSGRQRRLGQAYGSFE